MVSYITSATFIITNLCLLLLHSYQRTSSSAQMTLLSSSENMSPIPSLSMSIKDHHPFLHMSARRAGCKYFLYSMANLNIHCFLFDRGSIDQSLIFFDLSNEPCFVTVLF
jgi:hypothetical protein